MTEVLLALPPHLRKRLESALEAGTLGPPYRPVAVCAALGGAPESDAVAGALAELARLGVSGFACAAWLRGFDRAAGRRAAPDFVWSGPEVAGLHARDLGASTRSCSGRPRGRRGSRPTRSSTARGRSRCWRGGWTRRRAWPSRCC